MLQCPSHDWGFIRPSFIQSYGYYASDGMVNSVYLPGTFIYWLAANGIVCISRVFWRLIARDAWPLAAEEESGIYSQLSWDLACNGFLWACWGQLDIGQEQARPGHVKLEQDS